ncbi:MAG TPA: hypothetical protein DEA82_04700 [Flavobacteriaceae bacterium]|nr:hypothetical protein [Flavobacteriaceae bacterium]HBR53510.1 hypothetical protein [Flavobacteriaceae bacterium]|tara:strand:- start:2941 stop:3780 length:840 start_codon:yes stop_codon:yes gene_type:complete
MKTLKKTIMISALFGMALFAVSCDKDDDTASEGDVANFSAENAVLAAKADNAIEGTLNIMETAFDESEGPDNGGTNLSLFSDCATIIVNANGDGTGTILLDFGDVCTLNNGASVSGKINLAYEAIVDNSRTINYTFENFTYNSNGVEGGGEIVRTLANANGNPASTVNETITVSFPSSTVTATREGLRVAEWVEGVGSGTWVDNVYDITGNWITTFSNGFERTGIVTETLVRRLDCFYLVAGELEVSQNGLTGSLDFGDGVCDNNAVFTFNGVEFPVLL